MLRRLRRRRSLLAGIAAGLLAVPALLGGVAAAPSQADNPLPPPEPNPRETLPPDPAEIQAGILLAQAELISDLAPVEFRDLVVAAANRHGVDPRLVAAIITVETEWDPTKVGIYGERGLMQLLPSTAEWLAETMGLENPDTADPATNLDMATWYLAALIREYGDIQTALAVYNGGPAAVEYAPRSIYARKVLKHYEKAPGDLAKAS